MRLACVSMLSAQLRSPLATACSSPPPHPPLDCRRRRRGLFPPPGPQRGLLLADLLTCYSSQVGRDSR